VLFVSHNMAAVQSLCERAIWLHEGQVNGDGPTSQIVSEYLKQALVNQTEQIWDDVNIAPGNDEVRIQRVSIRPENGSSADSITIRTPLVMEFDYWNLKSDTSLNLSLHLYNEQGIIVLNTFPVVEPNWFGKSQPAGLYRSTVHIPGDLLNDGLHRVTLLVVQDQAHVLYRHEDILVFDVQDGMANGLGLCAQIYFGKPNF